MESIPAGGLVVNQGDASLHVTVQHTEMGRYALITTSRQHGLHQHGLHQHNIIELLLDDTLPTSQNLRRHAEALRRDATAPGHFLAALIDEAADCYERGTE